MNSSAVAQILTRVPHLRDGLVVAKVGHFRESENPDTPKLTQASNRVLPDLPPTQFQHQKINSIKGLSKTKAKSRVKPQTHPIPSIQTTYPWHLSYLRASIIKIVEKTNQGPGTIPSGALLI
jgi:hypothetical protein